VSEKRDGYGCKTLTVKKIMSVFTKEAPTNFVPAVAVIRRELVLFVVIGRKAHVDGYIRLKGEKLRA